MARVGPAPSVASDEADFNRGPPGTVQACAPPRPVERYIELPTVTQAPALRWPRAQAAGRKARGTEESGTFERIPRRITAKAAWAWGAPSTLGPTSSDHA